MNNGVSDKNSGVPDKYFLTKGAGVHKEDLHSFEEALRDAKISQYNLVPVSSIIPPNCKRIPVEEGLKYLTPGQIVYCVMSRNKTNESSRLIAASVGCAIPAESTQHGYLSEHHSYGETDEKAADYTEDLAASMLATTLGLEFDPEIAWDEKEKFFKMSGKIVRTANITQSAQGNKDGLWTTVLAAAVFILEKNGLEKKNGLENTVSSDAKESPNH